MDWIRYFSFLLQDIKKSLILSEREVKLEEGENASKLQEYDH
jgi:hypothetical protein